MTEDLLEKGAGSPVVPEPSTDEGSELASYGKATKKTQGPGWGGLLDSAGWPRPF